MEEWLWNQVILNPNSLPSPRHLHTGILYQDKWHLFGGFHNDEPLDDLWIISLASQTCQQKLRTSNKRPSARHSHSASLRLCETKNNYRMVIFGGIANGIKFNDVWEYSFATSKWQELQCTGQVPEPMWGHSGLIHDDNLYIFGGFTDSWTNTLYKLNLDTLVWNKIDCKNAPSSRHFHSADLYNNKMYILGGTNNKLCSDFVVYDFETESWISVEHNNNNNENPTSKLFSYGHRTLVWKHYLVVFGGRDSEGSQKGLRLFDFGNNNSMDSNRLESSTWQEVIREPSPERYFHTMCSWQGNLYVFGGLGKVEEGEKFENLNDLRCFAHKENIFNNYRTNNGYFNMMPIELFCYLLSFLSEKDLLKVATLNHYFYLVSSLDVIWKPRAMAKSQTLDNKVDNYELRTDALIDLIFDKDISMEKYHWKSRFAHLCRGFIWTPNVHWDGSRISRGREVVSGDLNVGKSSLVTQLLFGELRETDPTIDDSYRKLIYLSDVTKNQAQKDIYVLFDILDISWDTAYSPIFDSYFTCSTLLVAVFALNSQHSFERSCEHIQRFARIKGIEDMSDLPVVLVGNKIDLEREVDRKVALEFAQQHGMPYLESCAKSGVNVNEVFYEVVRHEDQYWMRHPKPRIRYRQQKKTCCVQ